MARLLTGASGALYEVAIGLEVHAQVNAVTKLFSAASSAGGRTLSTVGPNGAVALFDAAHPGTLPVPGRVPVERIISTGVALRACISRTSAFDRKHYFYGDLPLGYQITQQTRPTVLRGSMRFDVPSGGGVTSPCVARVERVQLEQDSGKSAHDRPGSVSHVDLNRAGVALLEVVGSPDLRSAAEAGAYMRSLRLLLRGADIADGDADEGALRADVNVSVRRLTRGRATGSCGARPVGEAEATVARARVAAYDAWRTGIAARDDAGVFVYHDAASTVCAANGASVSGGWRWNYADDAADVWAGDALRMMQLDVLGAGGCGLAQGPCSCATRSAVGDGCTAPGGSGGIPWPNDWLPPLAPFGPRVELKNVSSIRAVERAIASEAARQVALLESGVARVEPETRSYDPVSDSSVVTRRKESAPDYRFMAEPDIAPILVSDAAFARLAAALKPYPRSLALAYSAPPLSLPMYDARVIVGEDGGPPYFEAALAATVVELQRRAAEDAVAAAPAGRIGHAQCPTAATVSTGATAVLATAGNRGAPISDIVPCGALPWSEHAAHMRIIADTRESSVERLVDNNAAPAQETPPRLSTAASGERPLLRWAAVAAANGQVVGPAVSEVQGAAPLPTREVEGVAPMPALGAIAKAVSNWMTSELFGSLQLLQHRTAPGAVDCGAEQSSTSLMSTERQSMLINCLVSPQHLGQLIALVLCGDLSGRAGKEVMRLMLSSSAPAAVREMPVPWPHGLAVNAGLMQLNDMAVIQALADEVVSDPAFAAAVKKVRAGADRPVRTLVAEVLKKSNGRANPSLVSNAVHRSLQQLPANSTT